MRSSRRCLLSAVVLALVLVGCGNDGDDTVGDLPPDMGEDPAEPVEDPEATPTVTPTPAATEQTYEVQSGDTLWDLAQRFDVSVDAIVEANDLADPEAIFPGDELVIPAPD